MAEALARGEDPLPEHVEIHPTDVCNHRCEHCYHGGLGSQGPQERMAVGRYGALFHELNSLGIRELSISGGGDPTLSPHLPKILDLAFDAGLRTRLVTHGTHVSPEVQSRISRLSELRVSIDAATAKTFSALRRVPEAWFYRAIETVRRAVGSGPLCGVTFVVSHINQHEVHDFVELFRSMPVDAIVFKIDVEPSRRLASDQYNAAVAKVRADADARIDVRPWVDPSPLGRPCRASYFKVAFDPTGRLFSCCLASQPRSNEGVAFGTLGDDGFLSLWQKSRPLRQALLRGAACSTCNVTDHHLNRALDEV